MMVWIIAWSSYLGLQSVWIASLPSMIFKNLFQLLLYTYIDGLVQKKCTSSANALELRLFCNNPFILRFISEKK